MSDMKSFPVIRGAAIARNRKHVAKDVSLSLTAGTVTRLIGANGTGKSTLLDSILGYIPLAGGARGEDLPNYGTREHQHYFGYCPSRVKNLPDIKIEDWFTLLDLGFSLETGSANKLWKVLEGRALPDSYVDELSSGNLKKILFLSSVIIRRTVLVLDEPFDEVDSLGRERMVELIKEQAAGGAGVLLVSHQMQYDKNFEEVEYVELTEGGLVHVAPRE